MFRCIEYTTFLASTTCWSDGFLSFKHIFSFFNSFHRWNLKGALWSFLLDKQFLFALSVSPKNTCIKSNKVTKHGYQTQMVWKCQIPDAYFLFLHIFLIHHASEKKYSMFTETKKMMSLLAQTFCNYWIFSQMSWVINPTQTAGGVLS